MRGLRYHRLMGSTALAIPLLVALTIAPSTAQTTRQASIEAAVPMPNSGMLPIMQGMPAASHIAKMRAALSRPPASVT